MSGGTVWAVDLWATDLWAVDFWTGLAAPKAKKGGRRKRKFSIEIDDELFVVASVAEAIDLLRVVKQTAKKVLPAKKAQIRIVGEAPKTVKREVERAQRVVSKLFNKQLDTEIGRLMRASEQRTVRINRARRENERRVASDEEAIAVLLLLS